MENGWEEPGEDPAELTAILASTACDDMSHGEVKELQQYVARRISHGGIISIEAIQGFIDAIRASRPPKPPKKKDS